ncbi:tetratricopeptide repeat protein [Photobacterium sp. MCCC 1A19761]|uniref:tetratricopeptide repeat protein n=1 Tax=Photobacterium sp. MCCC 1A19761 TaxID=3115000 RepID=UPI00307F0846
MSETIQRAIALRKDGNFEQSRQLLETLLANDELKAKAHLHIAWSYDNQGFESAAVPHYHAALSGELDATERFDALFGLASTLRSLGEYQEAIVWFEKTLALYPDAREVLPFYAMCLYNLGHHKQATELLLKLLIETTNAEEILTYQRAIKLYAQDLDRTWS